MSPVWDSPSEPRRGRESRQPRESFRAEDRTGGDVGTRFSGSKEWTLFSEDLLQEGKEKVPD